MQVETTVKKVPYVTRRCSYLAEGRLADVLALIQVLALDEHAHRSDEGLESELQGQPRSAANWAEIAQFHPEFFRVRPTGEHRVSLVARHVTPSLEDGRPPLSAEYTSTLLQLAVELHDREVKRSQRWHVWIGIIAVFSPILTVLAQKVLGVP